MLFRERLTVPIIWWVLAGLFSLSVLIAVGAYLGPAWGVGTSVAALLMAAAIFGSASIVISVDENGNKGGPGDHRARLYRGMSGAEC